MTEPDEFVRKVAAEIEFVFGQIRKRRGLASDWTPEALAAVTTTLVALLEHEGPNPHDLGGEHLDHIEHFARAHGIELPDRFA